VAFNGKGLEMESFLRIFGLVMDVLPGILAFVQKLISGQQPVTQLALPAPTVAKKP
jgi:hypothetical protein